MDEKCVSRPPPPPPRYSETTPPAPPPRLTSLDTVSKESLNKTQKDNTNNSKTTEISSREDEFLLEIECPICAEYMSPPIFQCATGHSICQPCRQKLPKCGFCKKDFTDTRNFSLENLSLKMSYPCVNKRFGCTARLSYSERDHHQISECLHKPYKCPVENCAWVGRLEDLGNHWESKNLEVITFDEKEIWHTDLNAEMYSVKLIKAHNKLFWLKRKLTGERIFWGVQYIGNDKDAASYSYKIEIFKKNLAKKIYISNGCHEIGLGDNKLFKSETCISFHLDTLRCLMNEKQELTYRFKISRNLAKKSTKI